MLSAVHVWTHLVHALVLRGRCCISSVWQMRKLRHREVDIQVVWVWNCALNDDFMLPPWMRLISMHTQLYIKFLHKKIMFHNLLCFWINSRNVDVSLCQYIFIYILFRICIELYWCTIIYSMVLPFVAICTLARLCYYKLYCREHPNNSSSNSCH